jgi:hypothetical protein
MSNFDEDTLLCRVAEETGLELSRYQAVEIVDESALKSAGLMCQAPDYQRIRRALEAGLPVAGARLGGTEYKLRRIEP